MSTLVHVNASARGDRSQSLSLADEFITELRRQDPDLHVKRVDLFHADLPEFGPVAAEAKMAVFAGGEQTDEQKRVWEQAREVFDEFAAGDYYVFNVPFWNAGVPYILKQWIDIISQPGWAFGFDPEKGYNGLVTGKKAFSIYTSGVYADGVPHEFGEDFTKTFFEDWLNFIGIEDRSNVHFGPTVANPDVPGSRKEAAALVNKAAQGFLK